MGAQQRHKGDDKKAADGKLKYFFTLFKIEGHASWRGQLHTDAEGFDREWNEVPKRPKITDRKVIIIDRYTGDIETA